MPTALLIFLAVPFIGMGAAVYWLRNRNIGLCVRCRYPRTGLLNTGRCPECGKTNDTRRREAKAAGLVAAVCAWFVVSTSVRLLAEARIPLPRHGWFRGEQGSATPDGMPRVAVVLDWTQWSAMTKPAERFWVSEACGHIVVSLSPPNSKVFSLRADIERETATLMDCGRQISFDSSGRAASELATWLADGWTACSADHAAALSPVVAAATAAAKAETSGSLLLSAHMARRPHVGEFSSTSSGLDPVGLRWREVAYVLLGAIPAVWLTRSVLCGARSWRVALCMSQSSESKIDSP